jgi:RimJ/RimL family protein N-acetyltransferase
MDKQVVTIDDGTVVTLRPVGADDKPLLEEGMARLSENSRRLRFMVPTNQLSRSQLAYLTEVDQEHHIAWGALVDGQPVAVGRLVRLADDPHTAELAVTVVDDFQRRGLGTLMVCLLAEIARGRGIDRFVFEALAENEGILRLLGSLGATWEFGEGVVTGEMEVARIPAPRLVDVPQPAPAYRA